MNNKQKSKLDEPTLNHNQQLEDCFDTNSEYFNKMMAIVNHSDRDKDIANKHHIVPRSYFKNKGWIVDDSDNNIAYITPYEHAYIHYYAWKCAKPIIRRSMATAWHFMINTAAKDLRSIDTIAVEYEKSRLDMMSSKSTINNRLSELKSSFICKEINKETKKALFHCNNCGYEKWVPFSYHKKETTCKYCKFTSNRPYKGKYGLIMAILEDKHAYYLSFDIPKNKQQAYTWNKLMTHACRYVNRHQSILKWKLIGATDTNYKYPYICPVSKEYVDNYMYFAKFDSGIRNALFPEQHRNIRSMIEYAKYYNIDIPKKLGKEKGKVRNIEYYIDDFDEWHTVSDWEALLGYTWVTITRKYKPNKELTAKEAIKYLYEAYRKDATVFDRLKSVLDLMVEVNEK